MDRWTVGASLALRAVLTMPCGRSDGLPVGLQLMAPTGRGVRLGDAAACLEPQTAQEWWT